MQYWALGVSGVQMLALPLSSCVSLESFLTLSGLLGSPQVLNRRSDRSVLGKWQMGRHLYVSCAQHPFPLLVQALLPSSGAPPGLQPEGWARDPGSNRAFLGLKASCIFKGEVPPACPLLAPGGAKAPLQPTVTSSPRGGGEEACRSRTEREVPQAGEQDVRCLSGTVFGL